MTKETISTAAYPMRILRKHGLAPTDSASQRSEIATMLISRWLAAALGISAILTKTSYSKPFLITDFLNRNDGRRCARLLVREDTEEPTHAPDCQKRSSPSLKVWVASSMEMMSELPDLYKVLSGTLKDGQKLWIRGLPLKSGSLSALTCPATPVSVDYWQEERCSAPIFRVVA